VADDRLAIFSGAHGIPGFEVERHDGAAIGK
jgi:hypothetical protein